ncbi:CD4-2 molecule, tandem duplicate 2 isoform X2 [Plectropomus leopardus]|uniref:CD4-2 molecule, tandem duplicate 2 isoform X2 n=1 Tax=Plectropomus leopardus TaxID=160734 RepID=UPI001C4BDE7F|nr:CD4-2 molecule, tandem duplicate 2 isoform X2 [Plectropomus leopardus]
MKTILWFGFVLRALFASGSVILTKPGSKTTIKCGVNKFASSLEWQRENIRIIRLLKIQRLPSKDKTDLAERSSLRSDINLEISRVKEQDGGKFTCLVDGKEYEHRLLVFSVFARPSKEIPLGSEVTLQCQVRGLDPPDSPVKWQRPDGSPHAGSQTVELKPVARSHAGIWTCMFSQDGEEYSQRLEIKVQEPQTTTPSSIKNPKDGSRVTHSPPKAGQLLGLSWWMWAAIGGGCVVVVLLMVFVIILCKKIKRRKRKFETMKNGRQPPMPKKYCQCNRPAAAAKPQQGRRREKPSAPPLQPLLME